MIIWFRHVLDYFWFCLDCKSFLNVVSILIRFSIPTRSWTLEWILSNISIQTWFLCNVWFKLDLKYSYFSEFSISTRFCVMWIWVVLNPIRLWVIFLFCFFDFEWTVYPSTTLRKLSIDARLWVAFQIEFQWVSILTIFCMCMYFGRFFDWDSFGVFRNWCVNRFWVIFPFSFEFKWIFRFEFDI